MVMIATMAAFLAFGLVAGALRAFVFDSGVIGELILAMGSASFSVGLALIAVNIIINSEDRRMAAAPLLNWVSDLATVLNNTLWTEVFISRFGTDSGSNMIKSYVQNGYSPKAFSPTQVRDIYEMIISIKEDLKSTYDKLEKLQQEVARILGWSYDSRILACLLQSRIEMLRFLDIVDRELPDAESEQLELKRRVVELYLDVRFLTTGEEGWIVLLHQKLGKKSPLRFR